LKPGEYMRISCASSSRAPLKLTSISVPRWAPHGVMAPSDGSAAAATEASDHKTHSEKPDTRMREERMGRSHQEGRSEPRWQGVTKPAHSVCGGAGILACRADRNVCPTKNACGKRLRHTECAYYFAANAEQHPGCWLRPGGSRDVRPTPTGP